MMQRVLWLGELLERDAEIMQCVRWLDNRTATAEEAVVLVYRLAERCIEIP